MSSRLQLVKAGTGVIAGNIVWFMPERLESGVLHKVRYINTLTFTLYIQRGMVSDNCAWGKVESLETGWFRSTNLLNRRPELEHMEKADWRNS